MTIYMKGGIFRGNWKLEDEQPHRSIMETKQAVAHIVNEYRKSLGGGSPLSFRKFADEINAGIEESVSFQSVSNWASGKYEPDAMYLIAYLMRCTDWRANFAQDLLSVIKPDNYQPATEIGRGVR